MARTDASTLSNLNELFELEAQRRIDEAVAQERCLAKDRLATVQRDANTRLEEALVASLEEHARTHDVQYKSIEDRIASLRDALDSVRSQRVELSLRFAEIANRQRLSEGASKRHSWSLVLAALSLVAAGIAVITAWPVSDESASRQPQVAVVAATAVLADASQIQAEQPALDESEVSSGVHGSPVTELEPPTQDVALETSERLTQRTHTAPPRATSSSRDRGRDQRCRGRRCSDVQQVHGLNELHSGDQILSDDFLRDVR